MGISGQNPGNQENDQPEVPRAEPEWVDVTCHATRHLMKNPRWPWHPTARQVVEHAGRVGYSTREWVYEFGRFQALLNTGRKLGNRPPNLAQIGTEFVEDPGGHALPFAEESQQEMLGADVVVAKLHGFSQRQFHGHLGGRSERDVATDRMCATANHLDNLVTNRSEIEADAFKRFGRVAAGNLNQPEKEVLCADEVVVQGTRLVLRQDHGSPSPLGEAFKHQQSVGSRPVGPGTGG